MNKKLTILATLIILCGVAFSGCIDPAQEQVEEEIQEEVEEPTQEKLIVDGGSSLVPVANRLGQLFTENTGIEVTVNKSTTGLGVRAAGKELANIGMGGRDFRESELVEFPDLRSVKIAKDGVSIIVHPNNPINSLTIDEIRKVFSGEIENWNQIGGKDAEITIITRQKGAGLRDMMINIVMGDAAICENAIIKQSTSAARDIVSNNEFAIGFVGFAAVDETVRSIKVNGIAPTYENIQLDEYPITRFMYFYTLGEPDVYEQKFIDLTLSNKGQTTLKEYGFISLKDCIVEEIIPTPTQGTITIKGVGILEKEIKVSELAELESVTREVTIHKGRPRERTFEVSGPLLDTVLNEKFGISQKDLGSIRLTALDDYSIEITENILQNREIILGYIQNCEKYGVGVWKAFEKNDGHWPIRVIVPYERGMFWVRMLDTIEILESNPKLNTNQVVIFETKISTLEQIPCSKNTYTVVNNKEFFKGVLERGVVRLVAADGLKRNEEFKTFHNAYIQITGEDAPRFYSPDLPRGMHVRYLYHFATCNTAYFVLSYGLELLELKQIEGKEGLPLTAIMNEVGTKDGTTYRLTTVDGTYITITDNEFKKGIVYKEVDGSVSVVFEGLPKYSLSGLLSIKAIE
jgi:phosphate binding protein